MLTSEASKSAPLSDSAVVMERDGRVALLVEHVGIHEGARLVVDPPAGRYVIESEGMPLVAVENANVDNLRLLAGLDEVSVFEREPGEAVGGSFAFFSSIEVVVAAA